MEKPDLDGYPILRIDQLSLIDIPTLEKSIPDAKVLIENLREESGKSQKSMIKYLQKQLNQTEKEIATRTAEDRVNSLLSGTKELHVRAIPPNLTVQSERDEEAQQDPPHATTTATLSSSSVPKPVTSTTSTHPHVVQSTRSGSSSLPPPHPKAQDPPPVSFYQPIPLPSQLAAAAANSHKPKLSRAQAKEQEQEQQEASSSGSGSGGMHISRSAGSHRERGRLADTGTGTGGGVEMLTSRSSGGGGGGGGGMHTPSRHTASSRSLENDFTDGTATGSGLNGDINSNSNSKPRRRPRSGNAVSTDNKPKSIYSQANLSGASEKQNIMSIQQNFGNAFMVGATEKKKRFYPKKVVQETEAERREKLREKGYGIPSALYTYDNISGVRRIVPAVASSSDSEACSPTHIYAVMVIVMVVVMLTYAFALNLTMFYCIFCRRNQAMVRLLDRKNKQIERNEVCLSLLLSSKVCQNEHGYS